MTAYVPKPSIFAFPWKDNINFSVDFFFFVCVWCTFPRKSCMLPSCSTSKVGGLWLRCSAAQFVLSIRVPSDVLSDLLKSFVDTVKFFIFIKECQKRKKKKKEWNWINVSLNIYLPFNFFHMVHLTYRK